MKDPSVPCEDKEEMNWRGPPAFSALAAVTWICAPRVVLAAAPTCSPVEVHADDRVRASWPELPERIHGAFVGRDDIDACARIELTMRAGERVDITVVLPDGRVASRSVGAGDVLPTLEALLLVPRGVSTAAPPVTAPLATDSAGQPAPVPTDRGSLVVMPVSSETPHEATPPGVRSTPLSSSQLRIELSVLTEASIGDGQKGLGLGLTSLLDVGGWLGGFEGRVDRYDQIGGGPPGGALAVSAVVGRRLRLQTVAVDFLAGPALALRGEETKTTVSPGAVPTTQSNRDLLPRAMLSTRLDFNDRSMFRAFVGLDGELGPAGAQGGQRPGDAPGLPIWTVGLALGGTVGTL
jgi:hypothetical protein